jgi:hypothetical protein
MFTHLRVHSDKRIYRSLLHVKRSFQAEEEDEQKRQADLTEMMRVEWATNLMTAKDLGERGVGRR